MDSLSWCICCSILSPCYLFKDCSVLVDPCCWVFLRLFLAHIYQCRYLGKREHFKHGGLHKWSSKVITLRENMPANATSNQHDQTSWKTMHPHDMTVMDLDPKRRIRNRSFRLLPELMAKSYIIVWSSKLGESWLVQVNKVLRMEIKLWFQSCDIFVALVACFHLLVV